MRLLVALSLVLLTACSSSFETRPYNASTDGARLRGVRYYEAKLFLVTYSNTALTSDKGVLIGTADSKHCRPLIQKQELQVFPDFAAPRVIIHKPSWFSASKLGVSLDRGVLTGINVESVPTSGTLITSLGTIAAAGVALLDVPRDDVLPACNAAPVISSVMPYPAPVSP